MLGRRMQSASLSSMATYGVALHAPRGMTARQGSAIVGLVPLMAKRGFASTRRSLAEKKMDQEEADELAREAKLRAKFENKQSGGVFGNMFGGGNTSTNSGPNPNLQGEVMGKLGPFKFIKKPKEQRGAQGLSFGEMFIWFLALYTLVIYYLSHDPRRRSWHGIEWWAQPADNTAAFILTRLILPGREQSSIRQSFYNMTKANQTLGFGQFLAQYHPAAMNGNTCTQQELISAMSAVVANSQDLTFMNQLEAKTRYSSDARKNADAIMDALRSNFGHLLNSGVYPQQAYWPQQQQAAPMGMPMMMGGGGGGAPFMMGGAGGAPMMGMGQQPPHMMMQQQQGQIPNLMEASGLPISTGGFAHSPALGSGGSSVTSTNMGGDIKEGTSHDFSSDGSSTSTTGGN